LKRRSASLFAAGFLAAFAGASDAAAQVARSTATADDIGVTSIKDRQLLLEMRRRRVIRPDQGRWTPEEYTTLLRVREAEKLGAFKVLRDRLATLKTLAVEQDDGGGKRLWLTREGYDMFLFVKAQNARAYFETRGHQAKDVLLILSNLRGERLFDADGALTQAGDEIYNRVQRGIPAFWRGRDGRIDGNARPPRDGSLPPGETGAAPYAPVAQSLADAQALGRVSTLMGTGYLEITEGEALHLMQVTVSTQEQLSK